MLKFEPARTEDQSRNSSMGLKSYLDDMGAVLKRVPAAWVRCELHALKVGDRFTRMEFIESDREGRQIAKVQGGCWPAVWRRVQADFEAAGLALEAGTQVLVKLQGSLSASFGFQVSVIEVDLTFALGDLNARTQSIRKSLQEAGLWTGNRSLPMPLDFVRVAVIAPVGAAGLGDFRSTADRLAAAGLVEFSYHEVPFQTRDAPARIVDALRAIYRSCAAAETRPCAVAIIRGGGASADLAWLVDQKLTEAVCRMKVPVITGIGHERDRNLLDEVACLPCDTPSKAVEHIMSTIVRAARDGERAIEATQSQVARHLTRHEINAAAQLSAVDRHAREIVRSAETKVRAAALGLEPGARALLDASSAGVRSARLSVNRDSVEIARLAEVGVKGASARIEPWAHASIDASRSAVAASAEDVRTAARHTGEAATEALRGLRREVHGRIEGPTRSLEVDIAGARAAVKARLEALPQVASEGIDREQRIIIEEARRTVEQLARTVQDVRLRIVDEASRSLEGCSAAITTIQERAEALHPRNVLAAGYAILRGLSGEPLTSITSVEAAGRFTAEMRDGTIGLRSGSVDE